MPDETAQHPLVGPRVGGQHRVLDGGGHPSRFFQGSDALEGIGGAQQPADAVEQPAPLPGTRRIPVLAAAAAAKRSAAVSQAYARCARSPARTSHAVARSSPACRKW